VPTVAAVPTAAPVVNADVARAVAVTGSHII